LMQQFLGPMRNAHFPHSTRLRNEYSLRWVEFNIIWSIL
jgi:hypothetical protein